MSPTAIVVGAGKIGNAVAGHLAATHDVHQASHAELELGDPESVRRYFARFAWFDVLVLAAGVYGSVGRVRDVAPGAWRAGLEVNLVGMYACCHYALPRLRAGGHVVFLGGGGKGPLDLISGYAAAKSGLWRLVETLASEEPALHVNAIAPGPMDSRMQDAVLDAPAKWAEHLRAMRAGRDPGVPVENTLRALDHLLATRPTGVMLFGRDFAAPTARLVAGL